MVASMILDTSKQIMFGGAFDSGEEMKDVARALRN